MEREYESLAASKKEAKEQVEKLNKEIKLSSRIEATWNYLEELKKLQSLEIEIETLKKSLRMKELRFPDLKGARGAIDHLQEERYWEVEVDGKKKIVPGKSFEDASERFNKKLAQERKNAEKQKEESKGKKKKQKLDS